MYMDWKIRPDETVHWDVVIKIKHILIFAGEHEGRLQKDRKGPQGLIDWVEYD